ncbi:MAG: hypothetical protein K1X72_21730 [Pyrinomonadaceae bacterium]|nr:hypothetical protein [Pyrinomonadaceae bacterium]
MKQCPKCSATYNNENAFCLNDGAALISQSEEFIPPTVVQFSPGQPNNPSPPVFSNVPQQSYQQPQFNQQQQSYQQPQFNQPQNFAQPMPPPGRKMTAGRLIVLGIVLLLGFSSIIGGLITFFAVSSRSSLSNTSSNPNSTRSSNPTSYSQDTGQGEKVGFKIVSVEDATSQHFFPNANKTSAVTYDDGSNRIVSFLSVYNSPADAASAFQKHLENVQKDGFTITSKDTTYAYYNKGTAYVVCLYVENKLYEYNARNQQTLYKFAK